MKNADMPAMPVSEEETDRINDGVTIYSGLTKREQACIQLGVPETGDEELDNIIRKSELKKASIAAMQGVLYSHRLSINVDIPSNSVRIADALLKELEK